MKIKVRLFNGEIVKLFKHLTTETDFEEITSEVDKLINNENREKRAYYLKNVEIEDLDDEDLSFRACLKWENTNYPSTVPFLHSMTQNNREISYTTLFKY